MKFLESLDIFGLSDHDLLFSDATKAVNDDDMDIDPRVERAANRIQIESASRAQQTPKRRKQKRTSKSKPKKEQEAQHFQEKNTEECMKQAHESDCESQEEYAGPTSPLENAMSEAIDDAAELDPSSTPSTPDVEPPILMPTSPECLSSPPMQGVDSPMQTPPCSPTTAVEGTPVQVEADGGSSPIPITVTEFFQCTEEDSDESVYYDVEDNYLASPFQIDNDTYPSPVAYVLSPTPNRRRSREERCSHHSEVTMHKRSACSPCLRLSKLPPVHASLVKKTRSNTKS